MIDHNHSDLPSTLREAARVMRESPPPSDVWRHRLLRAIEQAPSPRPGVADDAARRWTFRPLTIIAAGLVCALVGGAIGAVIMRNIGGAANTRVAVAPQHERVRFSLVAPTATHVSIVGDFNAWNPTALPLHRSADGRTWEVLIPLRPGRYAYAFVVDGELARDPSAPQVRDEDFGTVNSVVMVKGS